MNKVIGEDSNINKTTFEMEYVGNKFESELNKKVVIETPDFLQKGEKLFSENIEKELSKSSKGVKDVPFAPMSNGIVVAYDAVEKTAAGIIISKEDSLQEDVLEVLAVGSAVREIKPGDLCIARGDAKPIKFSYAGLTYLHFREPDFIVILNSK